MNYKSFGASVFHKFIVLAKAAYFKSFPVFEPCRPTQLVAGQLATARHLEDLADGTWMPGWIPKCSRIVISIDILGPSLFEMALSDEGRCASEPPRNLDIP